MNVRIVSVANKGLEAIVQVGFFDDTDKEVASKAYHIHANQSFDSLKPLIKEDLESMEKVREKTKDLEKLINTEIKLHDVKSVSEIQKEEIEKLKAEKEVAKQAEQEFAEPVVVQETPVVIPQPVTPQVEEEEVKQPPLDPNTVINQVPQEITEQPHGGRPETPPGQVVDTTEQPV